MSVVTELRQALQDVVAPDLKALVAGIAALRQEMSLLREDLHSNVTQLRVEIVAAEKRTAERLDRVYDAVKIADLTRRNTELEKQLEEMRKQTH
jgi:uncharacterized protein involved in exopolysaccharide biosynthesis